jgi:pimeloyl-ACP methyl ester carboxylesterase
MQVGGLKTAYLRAGASDLPPLLLLHDGAWGGSSTVTWGNAIEELAESFYVLAPDLLGFGESDKVTFFDRSSYDFRGPHVRALAREVFGDRPVNVVGNSYGGSLALRMLTMGETNWIRTAVSIAGTGGPWKSELSSRELPRWDGTRDDLARVTALLVDREHERFEEWVDARLDSASQLGHFRAVASAAMPMPQVLKQSISDPWPQQLAGVVTPLMIVAGERDVLLEPDWTDRIKTVVPHARVVKLDARHEPNIDHPDEIIALIRAFCA